MTKKGILLVLFFTALCIQYLSADELSIRLSTVVNCYSFNDLAPDQQQHDDPYAGDIGDFIQLNYLCFLKRNRLVFGLAYMSYAQPVFLGIDNLSSSLLDASLNSKSIHFNTNYSFDVLLSRKWLLNPEIGLVFQKHIPERSYDNNSDIEFSSIHKWPIMIGLNLNTCLKYKFENNNTLGIGFNGNLPLYKVKVGEYKIVETGQVQYIRSGCSYYMIFLSYSFSYDRLMTSVASFFQKSKSFSIPIQVEIN